MPKKSLDHALKTLRLRKPTPRFRTTHQAHPEKRTRPAQLIEVMS